MADEHRTFLDGDNLRSWTIADTSSLPFFPPVMAAEDAVRDILKREFITGEDARKRVRVEITREIEREIRAHVSTANHWLAHDPRHIGPMQIMGVSYYVVDSLPEPGWRVLP